MSMTVEQVVDSLDQFDRENPPMNERVAQAFKDSALVYGVPLATAAGMATVIQWMLEQEMIQ